MRRPAGIIAVALVMLLMASARAIDIEGANEKHWNFSVYLDDSEIGHHNFHLSEHDGSWLMTTEADFRVRFLFFTAYQYQHSSREVWQGDCLQRMQSTTNANGKAFAVNGFKNDTGFRVETDRFEKNMGECVKSFAYWDSAILDEPALLNSQTGELLPVEIEPVAEEILIVRGEKTPAVRYQLSAKNMELNIWYGVDERWLALESTVKGGRKLRYELT